MTFLYSELPLQEGAAPAVLASQAAPTVHGSLREQLLSSPKPDSETCPNSPSDSGPSGEVIRHVLIGSPEGVRATIHRLYRCRYAEVRQWTGPISIGPKGVHIARDQGQILYYLMRLRSFDLPTGQ